MDDYTDIGPGANYFGEQNGLTGLYPKVTRYPGNCAPADYCVLQIRFASEHEFEGGNVRAFGSSVEERDEDLAIIGANLSCYFDNGWNVGLEYEGRFGSKTEGHYGGVRLRKEF